VPNPNIQYHRQVLAAVEQNAPLPPDAAAWFVGWNRTWLARAEAGRPISMEAAAGLGAPGRPNWKKQEERQERDAALRELHRQRFPHLVPRHIGFDGLSVWWVQPGQVVPTDQNRDAPCHAWLA